MRTYHQGNREFSVVTPSRKYLQSIADKQGFLYKKGHKKPTLKIFPDGSIIRAGVDLELCTNMTVTDAYKALNLTHNRSE